MIGSSRPLGSPFNPETDNGVTTSQVPPATMGCTRDMVTLPMTSPRSWSLLPPAESPLAGRRLWFVGIGGAGLSAYALLARAWGAEVGGWDRARTPYLAALAGIRVEIGDDVIDGTVASRLADARRRIAG